MKRIVLAVLALLLLLAVAAALWRCVVYPQRLPFESKIEHGYLELAFREAKGDAVRSQSPEDMQKLLRVLTLRGNVGRASILAQLFETSEPTVKVVRDFQERVVREVRETGTVKNHFADGELSEFRKYPVYANLKFFVGYQLALLGDWNAARDYFLQAERNGVSPELAPYLKYYLARALIIKGSETEKQKGRRLLSSLFKPTDPYRLNSRILLNQLSLAIKDGESSRYPWFLKRIQRLHNRWEYAKALNDLGAAYLKEGKLEKAYPLFAQALLEKNVYGTQKTAVNGMWSSLLDGGATPASTSGSRMPEALYRLAELVAGTNRIVEAMAKLRQIADDTEFSGELRGAALAGLARMGVEASDPPDYYELVAQAESLSSAGPWAQLVHLNHARRLVAEGKPKQAESEFGVAAKMNGQYAADALYEHYRLLKAQGGFYNVSAKIRLLEELTSDPPTEHFLEAAEELIPLHLYRGESEQAMALVKKVQPIDEALAAYWQRFASKRQNQGENSDEREQPLLGLKRFSYYEVSSVRLVDTPTSVVDRKRAILLPETPEEYLVGVFATDLALSVASAGELSDLPPMAAAVVIRNLEMSKPLNVSSWYATELLESGKLQGSPVLPYVLDAAYPRPFLDVVSAAASRYRVDLALIYAVMKKESNFRAEAVSSSGAIGLMQLMPATAALHESRLPTELRDAPLTDPKRSIYLGAAYIADQMASWRKEYLALASYNAGPGTLKAWLEQIGSTVPELFINLIPSPETETFVKKTLKYKEIYEFLLEHTVSAQVQVE